MTVQTIKKLNQLNRDFYQLVHAQFDHSRQHPWPGWTQLLPWLDHLSGSKQLAVLDLGCGNGRFGEFLAKNLPQTKLDYTGADNNQSLLDTAAAKLKKLKLQFQLRNFDLVESLLQNDLSSQLSGHTFDLIVLSGILHHVPSFALRRQLISQLSQLLNANGLMVIACWQFAKFDRFKAKVIDCDKIGLTQADLEKNDYILDWQTELTAYRYCHFTNEEEMRQLATDCGLNVKQQFTADGKTNNMNRYYILNKHGN